MRRVVITGLGAVCAPGIGVKALWEALLEQRSGISLVTRYDTEDMQSRIGGEVKDFDPFKLIDRRMRPKRLSRQAQFALVAGQEAVADSGMSLEQLRAVRSGVVLGSAFANIEAVAETALKVQEKGPNHGTAAAVPLINMQSQATALVEMLGLENAPALCVSTSCMAGVDAVTLGCDMIRAGRAEAMICGGTDAPLSRTPAAEFQLAGMCSTRNAEPGRASRPFDRERDNGLLAEGAGIVVLETLEHALARGARPYAEILGYATCRDPAGAPAAAGLSDAMRGALENAGCAQDGVECVCAWGSGDPVIDREETRAIKAVFGARAYDLAIHSIKAVTGNPLAAAGALQMVSSAMAFRCGLVPPTTNYEHPDLDCDLDYVAGAPRRIRLRRLLLNAHGLGGGNTSLVMGAPPLA
jgi:3-oxoacyl-[acyl-carrier-protein] synthase II